MEPYEYVRTILTLGRMQRWTSKSRGVFNLLFHEDVMRSSAFTEI